jgi:hypothetical protein
VDPLDPLGGTSSSSGWIPGIPLVVPLVLSAELGTYAGAEGTTSVIGHCLVENSRIGRREVSVLQCLWHHYFSRNSLLEPQDKAIAF